LNSPESYNKEPRQDNNSGLFITNQEIFLMYLRSRLWQTTNPPQWYFQLWGLGIHFNFTEQNLNYTTFGYMTISIKPEYFSLEVRRLEHPQLVCENFYVILELLSL
jgi:hypothetical protein